LAVEDVQMLMRELDKDSSDKIEKVTTILFELLSYSEEMTELREDALKYLRETIKFCMKTGGLATILRLMEKTRAIIENTLSSAEMRRDIMALFTYLSGDESISLLGELLDSSVEVSEDDFTRFVEMLDKSAIPHLVRSFGELQSKRGREKVIDALILLGPKDIRAVARGINDQRWHVVKSIIYILRRIGDKAAIEHLLKAVTHADARVRKDVARTLGELGKKDVLIALRRCLDDADGEVRTTAARAIAAIGSETGKRIILDKIANKEFKEKDFEEKKEFYEVLSRWKDREVFEFLIETLHKKSFFERSTITENRACAAYCLGLLGNKDALPSLHKYKDDKHKLLRDFSSAAIKRLERGQ
ncbi:MAG: hypothetical protein FJ243_02030, partial [Nitrospira sp.]|nr:hypothetical protein [Nitrospira sp.]